MSRDWRMAHSLERLLTEVNEFAPHRRKDSDGGIGNAEHAARTSDHNPYIVVGGIGVVRAYDFTHAPETGFDAYAYAAMLLRNRDPRIRYVISNHKIASGKGGPDPWVWRAYSGPNPHDHHTHVSVTENVTEFDSPASWKFDGLDEEVQTHAPEANVFVVPPATLRIGSRGELVRTMQDAIGLTGKDVDGFFGAKITFPALENYQREHGLQPVDGVCGPATWKVINSK